jgi:hypothetical protein
VSNLDDAIKITRLIINEKNAANHTDRWVCRTSITSFTL